MITFNVGPSRISDEVKKDIKEALSEGILEISHRSEDFTKISEKTVRGMKSFLGIPKDYEIIFTSSATESMQLAVQNCCDEKAFHFVNGNFSKLFSEISKANGKKVFLDEVNEGELNDFPSVEIDKEIDFISITHNETSAGVMCQLKEIAFVREKNPDSILAIDITSSAGAIQFDFALADIWLFSVQKCLGLPSGLGILVLSPRAVEKSNELDLRNKSRAGIFTFERLRAKMIDKYQTFSTPNVLGIFLLSKIFSRNLENGGMERIQEEMKQKEEIFTKFVENNESVNFFVKDLLNRSNTVFCIESSKDTIMKLHKECREKGFLLGKGYGDLKETTIRIANFPAISVLDMENLVRCMDSVLSE